jgi:hypothetical protein
MERIILKCILKKYGLNSSGSGQRPVAGVCEHGNELSGFQKVQGFFFELLSSKLTVYSIEEMYFVSLLVSY